MKLKEGKRCYGIITQEGKVVVKRKMWLTRGQYVINRQ
jgi:hypothetical protein